MEEYKQFGIFVFVVFSSCLVCYFISNLINSGDSELKKQIVILKEENEKLKYERGVSNDMFANSLKGERYFAKKWTECILKDKNAFK